MRIETTEGHIVVVLLTDTPGLEAYIAEANTIRRVLDGKA